MAGFSVEDAKRVILTRVNANLVHACSNKSQVLISTQVPEAKAWCTLTERMKFVITDGDEPVGDVWGTRKTAVKVQTKALVLDHFLQEERRVVRRGQDLSRQHGGQLSLEKSQLHQAASAAAASSSTPSPQPEATKAAHYAPTVQAPSTALDNPTDRLKVIAAEQPQAIWRQQVCGAAAEEIAERLEAIERYLFRKDRRRPRGRRNRWGLEESYRLEWWYRLLRGHSNSELHRLDGLKEEATSLRSGRPYTRKKYLRYTF